MPHLVVADGGVVEDAGQEGGDPQHVEVAVEEELAGRQAVRLGTTPRLARCLRTPAGCTGGQVGR